MILIIICRLSKWIENKLSAKYNKDIKGAYSKPSKNIIGTLARLDLLNDDEYWRKHTLCQRIKCFWNRWCLGDRIVFECKKIFLERH